MVVHPTDSPGRVVPEGAASNRWATLREVAHPAAGVGHLLQGLRLLNQPGLRRFVLIPLLVNIVIFSLLIWFGIGQFEMLLDWLLPEDRWWSFLSWLLWPLFAIALVNDPEIVFLDEPTTGLDPVTANTINHLIRSLQKRLGVTSIVVTHDIHSAFTVGDRVAFLKDGKILFDGTVEEAKMATEPMLRNFLQGGGYG